MIIIECFFGLMVIFALLSLILLFSEWSHFKRGKNPYRRTCKKCGSIQEQFHRVGAEHLEEFWDTWWEEMYEGNNPKCKCHRYSEYREY